jgi:glutathione S-transferase
MALSLYAHPFSSYSWKVLIPLYESGAPFVYKLLSPDAPENGTALAKLWPIGLFPVLVDGERTLIESSVIVEYLDLHHPGPAPMIPPDPDAALEVRFLDRFFDNYVMTPMQRIVSDFIRPPEKRDPQAVTDAKALLDKAYAWLDACVAGREWAAGDQFSMADCAAAPSLFYADWVHPIADKWMHTCAYRARLLAHASVMRTVEEARPYRHFFPPGAPDRD